MTAWLMGGSVLSWLGVTAAARALRGGPFAAFAGVVVGVHTLLACAVMPFLVTPGFPWLGALVTYLQVVVYLHFFLLAQPSLKPLVYRVLVSIPASWFAAATFLSFPLLPLLYLGAPAWLLLVPYGAALVGVVQSLAMRRRDVDVVLDRAEVRGALVGGLARLRRTAAPAGLQSLRLVQITDPHLGPFMSVQRLARICQRAVDADPDLVLLTGDYLTMESQEGPSHLSRALAPLAALRGRVFASFGNHDHEAPDLVRSALAEHGITLLLDRATTVQTRAGRVQILGFDFHFSQRARRMADVVREFPREPGALRIVLMHDPGAFKHLPEGEGDLVLSGHTHGGQVGLVSLGLDWTALHLARGLPVPDHGLFGRGRDRLYVHRGTGHYGFPLRVGVPGEESVVHVHWDPETY